ncbi:uncharacterized protein LOC144134020 [Amblyomma americanum]
MHEFQGTNEELLVTLKDKCINISTDKPIPSEYTGSKHPNMDREIMASEARAALNHIKTTAAAGDNRITNKMLRNLDDHSVETLADLFNHHWPEGRLPDSSKHAKAIFILIPGKRLELGNMRPISFTSCLAKIMKHMILH